MAKDPATYFRATNGVLVDAIRISDFKANIAIVFVGIMMGPVVGARDKFPSYFSLAMVMAPFLIMYFCLLLCLLPRYPRMGRANLSSREMRTPACFRRRKAKRRNSSVCKPFARFLPESCFGRI